MKLKLTGRDQNASRLIFKSLGHEEVKKLEGDLCLKKEQGIKERWLWLEVWLLTRSGAGWVRSRDRMEFKEQEVKALGGLSTLKPSPLRQWVLKWRWRLWAGCQSVHLISEIWWWADHREGNEQSLQWACPWLQTSECTGPPSTWRLVGYGRI